MRVMVVGNGGREHALAWALRRSPRVGPLYGTRPNAGMAPFVIDAGMGSTEIDAIVDFAVDGGIDLVVVGPEAPLAAGLADRLRQRGVPVVGPGADVARLEASKAWARRLMRDLGVPTPPFFEVFDDAGAALDFVASAPHPLVVKASGLAAGKGVVVCATPEESARAVRDLMIDRKHGDAGRELVVEAFVEGRELSLIALCAGRKRLVLPSSQDHKRLLDGDRGPNTGGMGAYSPAPFVSRDDMEAAARRVIDPVLAWLDERGTPYCGFLYAGLMWTHEGPVVLEYNVRLGDPEAQALLVRFRGDFFEALLAAARGEGLDEVAWSWDERPAVCVVVAAEGYPSAPRVGAVVEGLAEAEAASDVVVFHAGTALDEQGRVVVRGGRVLGVSALGETLAQAASRAYEAVGRIHFEGMQFRRDIARGAIPSGG